MDEDYCCCIAMKKLPSLEPRQNQSDTITKKSFLTLSILVNKYIFKESYKLVFHKYLQ